MDNSYTGLAATLHDTFWNAEGDPAELSLLDSFLTRHPGPALEIGCGSGRLLLPLLAKGHALEGLDSSPEMLDLCRAAAADLGLAPVLHLADMATFAAPHRSRALAVPTFTLQLATDPAAVLTHFANLLEPAGALYLTVFQPLAELTGELPSGRWYPDHATTLADGTRASVTTRHTLDRQRRIVRREHRHELRSPGGELLARHESRQAVRWFAAAELESLLARAGFAVAQRIADFDAEAPPDEAQILTLEAIYIG